MLTIAVLSSLLLSSASAAAVGVPQQPLVAHDTNSIFDHVDQAGFQRFPIEAMSDTVFRLHHHAAKTLLGDSSYVVLRDGEIWKRRSEIFEYLDKHNLDCQEWLDTELEFSQENGRRIFMSGGRVFDANPERVPQEVITALQELSDQDHKNMVQFRRSQFCNATQSDGDHGKVFSGDNAREGQDALDQSWMITTPDEYIQYRLTEAVLDNMWRAKQERDHNDILAGKLSVRDVGMPDLSKCIKVEARKYRHRY